MNAGLLTVGHPTEIRDPVITDSVRPTADQYCEGPMGSVIKKRRKRMAKKKHRKLLRKTRHQRRNKK
ncbi:uncharacterized protein DUF1713 [Sediminihabitans luteus]|uniref:Uncharacterized protein DUF1713 n=1 Tax=Sediminihabitans luteus TaxID=1138585 RepID=A0A2M9D049_9CELL|nr:uncharacterized protein DUF1713 [Sediminihabitans luteus]GII98271.1 hypothetical protein Slu03_06490 [Sediminihabitans luteus]